MTTTLGAAESLSADVVITRELIASVGEVPLEELRTFRRTAERDLDSTHSRGRRAGPVVGPFVVGDAIRLRGLAARRVLRRLNDDNRNEQDTLRSLQVLAVLRSAVVYWLPGPTAHGMAQMTIATDDLVDVRMPHNHVLICFGSGFALEAWSGGEGEISRGRQYHVDLAEAVAGRPTPPDQVPAFIRNPTLALFRGEHVELLGVLVSAGDNGRLRDLLLSLVRVVHTDGTESITLSEGRLTTARIAPLVCRWMSVVAWGQWSSPSGACCRRTRAPSSPGAHYATRRRAPPKCPAKRAAYGCSTHRRCTPLPPNPARTVRQPAPTLHRCPTGDAGTCSVTGSVHATTGPTRNARISVSLSTGEGDLTGPPPTVYRLPPPP